MKTKDYLTFVLLGVISFLLSIGIYFIYKSTFSDTLITTKETGVEDENKEFEKDEKSEAEIQRRSKSNFELQKLRDSLHTMHEKLKISNSEEVVTKIEPTKSPKKDEDNGTEKSKESESEYYFELQKLRDSILTATEKLRKPIPEVESEDSSALSKTSSSIVKREFDLENYLKNKSYQKEKHEKALNRLSNIRKDIEDDMFENYSKQLTSIYCEFYMKDVENSIANNHLKKAEQDLKWILNVNNPESRDIRTKQKSLFEQMLKTVSEDLADNMDNSAPELILKESKEIEDLTSNSELEKTNISDRKEETKEINVADTLAKSIEKSAFPMHVVIEMTYLFEKPIRNIDRVKLKDLIQLRKGDELTVIEIEDSTSVKVKSTNTFGTWLKVNFGDDSGYVFSKFTDLKQE